MARGRLALWAQLILALASLGDTMCAGAVRGWMGCPMGTGNGGLSLRLAGGAGATATFQVLCQDTVFGESLAIVGSTESLNTWAKPVEMSGEKFPLWEVQVHLSEGEIEYKYVKVDRGGEIVCWESFEANRKVCVSPLMAKAGIVIQDGQFSVESKPKVLGNSAAPPAAPAAAAAPAPAAALPAPPPAPAPPKSPPAPPTPARAPTPRAMSPVIAPIRITDEQDAAALKEAAMRALGLFKDKAAAPAPRVAEEQGKEQEQDRLRLAAEEMARAQKAAEEEVRAVKEAARQALGLDQGKAVAQAPVEAAREAALASDEGPPAAPQLQERFASPPVQHTDPTPPGTRGTTPALTRSKPTPHAASLGRKLGDVSSNVGLRGKGADDDDDDELNAEAVRWRHEAEAIRLQAVEERDEELHEVAEENERRRKEFADKEYREWQAEREAWLREEREEREVRERVLLEEREKEALERVLLADRARRDTMQFELGTMLEQDWHKRKELVKWQEARVELAVQQEKEVQKREAFWEREVEERDERERKEREERERELHEAEERAKAAQDRLLAERRLQDEADSEEEARHRGRSTSEGLGGRRGAKSKDKGMQMTREIEERLREEERRLGGSGVRPEEVQASLDLGPEELAKLREVHRWNADKMRVGGLAAWFRKLGSLWSSKKQQKKAAK